MIINRQNQGAAAEVDTIGEQALKRMQLEVAAEADAIGQ